MFIWVALKEYVRLAKILWTITEVYSNQGFLPVLQEKFQKRYLHGPLIWKVMQRSLWKDIVSWRIKQRNNDTKSQRHALMTTNLKKKKWDQLENYPQFAHKLFWNVYMWLVLVDLVLYGPWTNLLVRSQNGPKLLTNAWIDWSLTFITYVNTGIILLCGKHSTTLQMRIVSRFWFRRRPWRLEVNSRRNSLHFRKSHVRTNKLDVQETDISFTQFHGSWNYFSWWRFTHGRYSRSYSLRFVIEIFQSSPNQTNKTKDVREKQENLSATRIKNAQQIPTTKTNLLQIDKFPNPQSFFCVENSIQNSSHSLFWFSFGHYVMDQRNGDGRFIGWIYKFVYKKNYLWRKRFTEILKSEVCTKWEIWRDLKNYELTKSHCKNWRNSWNDTKAHFQLQEMEEQMNSMNDSRTFQGVESNHSGRLSHVSSQLAMIPSSRSMLSRDKRLPLDTWNTPGPQENVFGNQFSTFDSPRDHLQGIHPCAPQRERGSVPRKRWQTK